MSPSVHGDVLKLDLFVQNSREQMLTHSTIVWIPCALQSVSIELLENFMFLFSSPAVEISICGILGRRVQSVMMFWTFFAQRCLTARCMDLHASTQTATVRASKGATMISSMAGPARFAVEVVVLHFAVVVKVLLVVDHVDAQGLPHHVHRQVIAVGLVVQWEEHLHLESPGLLSLFNLIKHHEVLFHDEAHLLWLQELLSQDSDDIHSCLNIQILDQQSSKCPTSHKTPSWTTVVLNLSHRSCE